MKHLDDQMKNKRTHNNKKKVKTWSKQERKRENKYRKIVDMTKKEEKRMNVDCLQNKTCS